MAKSRTKGGKKLDEFLRRAKTADGVNAVEIGFFSDAKYPDGTPVTNVAAWNEFGTENKDGSERIPERPFFRQAIPKMKTPVLAVLVADVNPRTMVVDRRTAERCGVVGHGVLQRQIVLLKEPPNAPATIKAKGSSNPLLDTGVLLGSATYRVVG